MRLAVTNGIIWKAFKNAQLLRALKCLKEEEGEQTQGGPSLGNRENEHSKQAKGTSQKKRVLASRK